MSKYLWKIGGEAGFGIMTTGHTLSKIICRRGYHVYDWAQYPSLIRGGHNTYDVVFSDETVTGLKWLIDCLVCLNKETFDLHKSRLSSESLVVYDKDDFDFDGNHIKINIPINKILKDLNGEMIMRNTIALGASLALMGGDLIEFNDMIKTQFGRKGEKVVESNLRFALEGFTFVKKNYADKIKPLLECKECDKKLVLSGNEAFSLGSIIADCRLYAAYPMTPATSVQTVLSSWQKKTGIISRHAEDEIAVINTAIGSAFAGARSSVGTSGGGFALMVEAISFAGAAEIPLVIFLSQRPGPATGIPTWTEQGDLLFAVHAGHGEFQKIVLSPGDVEEMVELTLEAYNLADVYQLPVIIMSDMLLSEAHQCLKENRMDEMIKTYSVNKGKTIDTVSQGKYLRYKDTEDGISPKLIPGTKDSYYLANSYEHDELGRSTEDSNVRIKQVNKRARKISTYLKNDFALPKIYGDINTSEIVFVSWGSPKGAILEVIKEMKKKDINSALIHFTHIYPLAKEEIKKLFVSGKRYILVENNSEAQFGKLLLAETGIEIKEKILKYDGRPFWPEEILEKLT